MLRIIIYMSLLLITTTGSAQNSITEIYVDLDGHNRSCFGGTGMCNPDRDQPIKESHEKTNTLISKTTDNKLKITLEKLGFTTKEWNELQLTKVFPVDIGSNIKIDSDLLRKLRFDPDANTIVEKDYPVKFERDTATFEIELEAP
ncbi:hypothetical protein [Flavobacterium sp. SM2513]|uniref:hypothetical protein n=1 Tax=Flavobacterium sp. SM2513 TaxID=3424766 RepID=UPI003D7FEE51